MSELVKRKKEYWSSPEGLSLIQGWARDGLTDSQIAERLGISRKTLWTWRGKYSELESAMRQGKEVADYAVESALFQNAMGGNVTAQIFWLKNRKPERWNDKREMEQEDRTVTIQIIRRDSPVARLDGDSDL
jgi:transcriptional regulator with XRE-family HTH domain